jgi:FAD/FMN-containing dehydrogenase
VRAVDAVTADGALVRASATQHADLFWAARGAGPGFFGVVTRFHLALHALPGAMQTSLYVYPLERLAELGGWLSDLAGALASDVELVLLACPGGTALPGAGPACVLAATAFADDAQDAADLLAPLDRAPLLGETLMVERTRPTSFDTLFDEMDRHFPARHRYLAEALWSDDPPQSVLAAVQPLIAQAPSPKSRLLCVMPPPPGSPVPDMAFSMAARLFLGCFAIWDDPAGDALNHSWHRAATAALERSAVGHYIGESDIAAAPARAPRSFSAAAWTRLRTVRQQYDPDGVFFDFP